MAECLAHDVVQSANQIPYFIRGKVTASSNIDDLLKCLSHRNDSDSNTCLYRFEVVVLESLKGDIQHSTLRFEYPFWVGCPGVDTFEVGEERVFAIGGILPVGQASLMGNSCAAHGFPTSDHVRLEKLRAQLGLQ